MGYRLHVAKTYKVEYALGDAFNHKVEEFHGLLSACGVDYSGEPCAPDFEVCRMDWVMMIRKLKSLDAMEDSEEKAEIRKCIEELESTNEEVVNALEHFLRNGDASDGYLHFSFF